MLFGVKLASEVYPPWKEHYINYDVLKSLLKEEETASDNNNNNNNNNNNDTKGKKGKKISKWTNDDEIEFVEYLDKELEKVYSFQSSKHNEVLNRLNKLEDELDSEDLSNMDFSKFQNILENSLTEAQELDNFSRLNFTGFTKIVKKHEKLHPQFPSLKSLLQVRLKELPFHSEEYSPLLYKISFLYNIFRLNNPSASASVAKTSNSLSQSAKLNSVSNTSESQFDTFKFWVHPDNLVEVKTRILRHLPLLVYASPPRETDDLIDRLDSTIVDENVAGGSSTPITADESTNGNKDSQTLTTKLTNKYLNKKTSDVESNTSSSNTSNINHNNPGLDPVITCLYFDNEILELYNKKLLRIKDYSTFRLRWTGRLINKPDVFLEKKTFVLNNNDNDTSKTQRFDDFEETRLKIKPKFINGFISGRSDYKDKLLYKLKQSGNEIDLEKTEEDCIKMQEFVVSNDLEPVLRTMYIRTAFQIPGDNKVRITIDSDILFIREDSFDEDRPIRNPESWHRTDIDSSVSNPLNFLRNGEFNKFPYSVMEIKVKRPSSATHNSFSSPALYSSKHSKWISELTNSHLVKEVPNFSKFVQGIASFYSEDDRLDYLPFWLPEVDSGIKIDPQQAFDEEQLKLKKQKESEKRHKKLKRFSMVGSNDADFEFIKLKPNASPDLNAANQVKSLINKSLAANEDEVLKDDENEEGTGDLADESSDDEDENTALVGNKNQLKRDPNFFDILTNSRLTNVDSEDEEIVLPPGVKKPTKYLKNAGPVKVEAKVWLANERTFNRWLHTTTLLSVLTFSIYNSTKKAAFPKLATYLAYVYFTLSILSGIWAYSTYIRRLNVIKQRSGQHLDAPLGPLVLATVVSITLLVNFIAAFKSSYAHLYHPVPENPSSLIFAVTNMENNIHNAETLPAALKPIQQFIFKIVNAF